MTRIRCGLATVVAMATAIALLPASPARAQNAELDAARERVATLEAEINREEAEAQQLQTQLRELSAAVGREQGNLGEIRTNLGQTRAKIDETTQRLDQIRNQIKQRARELYKRGPLPIIGVLLGAETVGEFVSRVAFARRVADRDGELVLEMRETEAELREIQAYQENLEAEQEATVASLERRQDQITDVFARQQVVLDDLARTRSEALALVDELESQLAAGELEGIRQAAGRGMPITYGEWAQAFLGTIGAPVVRNNLVVVVAWQASEGTQATWNPLATTKDMPGATRFNSHGVRNYLSQEQGIEASILTLELPSRGYEPILDGLERAAESMDTAEAINASLWCRGCAGGSYVTGIVPAVERYYDEYANR